MKKLSDVTYIVAKTNTLQTTVHVDYFTKYNGTATPSWMKKLLRELRRKPKSVGVDTRDLSRSVSVDTHDLQELHMYPETSR